MQFTTTKKDYSVSEFYEQFGESLPRIVKVNQGYFGKVATEVFDKEEIIWLQTVSKQQRVIAKFQQPNRPVKLLSIPVTYEEKLCVVKHGKPGKPKELRKILEKGRFPITVQFPKDQVITVDDKCMKTDYIPPLELSETFDEMYFLGNFITQGEMSDTVIDIPLYLSQLKLALVVGRTDMSDTEWDDYIERLTAKTSSFVYDPSIGHPDIAEYDPSAVHSSNVYSYVRPRAYSHILNIVNEPLMVDIPLFDVIGKAHSSFSSTQNDNTGRETIKMDQVAKLSEQEETNLPESSVTDHGTLQDFKDDKDKDARTVDDISSSTEHNVPVHAHIRKQMSTHATPIAAPKVPKVVSQIVKQFDSKSEKVSSPKEQIKSDVTQMIHSINLNTKSTTEPKTEPSKGICHLPLVQKGDDVTQSSHQPLFRKEDDVTRSSTLPSVQKEDDVIKSSNLPLVQSRDDVIKLSMSDVGEYLKVLKLEKYVDDFEAAMIDGRLLIDITKDILINEFGFKQTEVLRLMAFAKNGHLPK